MKIEIESAKNGFLVRKMENAKMIMKDGVFITESVIAEPTLFTDFDSMIDALQTIFSVTNEQRRLKQ